MPCSNQAIQKLSTDWLHQSKQFKNGCDNKLDNMSDHESKQSNPIRKGQHKQLSFNQNVVNRFNNRLVFKVGALFVLCINLLMASTHAAYAADDVAATSEQTQAVASSTTNQSTENKSTENKSTATQNTGNLDAIQTFVAGDFDKRKAMLNDWTGSVEEFDKLVALIESDELYQDNAGNVYLLKNEEALYSYPANKELSDWPQDLNQVTLTNVLKTALTFGQAKTKLKSTDSNQRLAAVQILSDNIDAVDAAMVTEAQQTESNASVKDALTQLQARIDFRSDDPMMQLAALATLKDSNSPVVLAEIEQALTQENLNAQVRIALIEAQSSIAKRIKMSEWSAHLFSGLSTASILLLAALGLAITYGLLGVINMAHGELIMIGAYATYVTQSLFKSYLPDMLDWYLLAAVPVAFLVSALVGMVIERIVIRPLYGRELETLLATFGVSLILMQLVRMIFGAQNVEVSNISWLSGAYQITPSLMLPYNRIAIIGFTILVLLLLVTLLNKTRFGLFVRAVTQNRQMARSVGIRSSRIDMLAFGLGSGLAGLAGCALAQVGNVGPDLGQNYIIDAFLVVVVGGVGQVMGAVLASIGLGVSGTVLEIGMGAVLAKIILLVLVIFFIQKRPQGLFALKGRFVE